MKIHSFQQFIYRVTLYEKKKFVIYKLTEFYNFNKSITKFFKNFFYIVWCIENMKKKPKKFQIKIKKNRRKNETQFNLFSLLSLFFFLVLYVCYAISSIDDCVHWTQPSISEAANTEHAHTHTSLARMMIFRSMCTNTIVYSFSFYTGPTNDFVRFVANRTVDVVVLFCLPLLV